MVPRLLRHPSCPCDAEERQRQFVQAVGLSRYLRSCLLPRLPGPTPTKRQRIRRLLDALEKVIADEV